MRQGRGPTELPARLPVASSPQAAEASSPKPEVRRELTRRELLRTLARGAAFTGLGFVALALLCRGGASETCVGGGPYQGCAAGCPRRGRCGFIRTGERTSAISVERRPVEVQRAR